MVSVGEGLEGLWVDYLERGERKKRKFGQFHSNFLTRDLINLVLNKGEMIEGRENESD